MPDNYPLIPTAVVQAHLDLRGILALMAKDLLLPEADSKELAAAQKRFDVLDREMRESRYRVGFVGNSGIGKSTVVQNVLGVDSDQSPTTQGTGKAATLTPTRVYAIPPGGTHSCTIWYMTRDQYQKRVEAIREFLKLPADSDQKLPQQLDELLLPASQDQLYKIAGDRKRAVDDIRGAVRYFQRLLESYRLKGSEYVYNDQPRQVTLPSYIQRREYTNHPDGDYSVSDRLLVHEVEIQFATNRIHLELEMIDLPGLGTVNATDDLTTELYLPGLAAAVVFRQATRPPDPHTNLLLNRLQGRFGDQMRERVWLCLTWFEGLGKEFLYGTPGQENPRTIFDNIMDTLVYSQDAGTDQLDIDNLTLVSKGCYDLRDEPRARKVERVSSFWPKDATTGQPIPPPGLEKYPRLWERIRDSLFVDGGIGRLREQLQVTLALRVKKAVEEKARRELKGLKEDIRSLLESAIVHIKTAGQQGTLLCAQEWKEALRRARQAVLGSDGPIDRAADWLDGELQKIFNGFCKADALWTPWDIRHHHAGWARTLQASAESLVIQSNGVPSVYKEVTDGLNQNRPATKVNLPLGIHSGPLDAWQALAKDDQEEKPWAGCFDSFTKVHLFSDGAALELDLVEYRDLMHLKITATVQQAFDEVARRVDRRITEIDDELGRFSGDDHLPPTAASQMIDKCREFLKRLETVEI
jgi:hypothetical protein